MEEEDFNIVEFDTYLLRKIQEYQKGELTEFNRGAVLALLHATEEFRRIADLPSLQE